MKLNMTVGQTDLRESVKKVLAKSIETPAYFQEYRDVEKKVKENIKKILFSDEAEIILKVGTGTLGLENVMYSVLDKGDKVLVVNQGHWSGFLGNLAKSWGAAVTTLNIPEGKPVLPEQIKNAIDGHKLVALVHSETNTGVLNPISEIGRIVKDSNALFMVDAISSFGGAKIMFDEWNIDYLVSIGQKCLNAPQGMPIIAVSRRGMEEVFRREQDIRSNTLDIRINRPSYILTNSLLAATQDIIEEGPENVFERHRKVSSALRAGLKELGLGICADDGFASPTCTRIIWPEKIRKIVEDGRSSGIDMDPVTRIMLEKHDVVMGEDRIGTMGEFATKQNILAVISAISKTLDELGVKTDNDAARQKIESVLE